MPRRCSSPPHALPPRLLPLCCLLCLGCAADTLGEPSFADELVEAPGAHDGVFGDPTLATNGVRGGGAREGSLDVFSLRPGDQLVLAWRGARVVDGPGDDLVVFENPFEFGDGLTFMDPVLVEVSLDGEGWVAFPHDYLAEDEAVYSHRREDWSGFAGLEPVFLHAEQRPMDPFDPMAGGDRFDLATLEGSEQADRIRAEGFRYVRLSPASDHDNPDTSAPFARDFLSDGPDIDGVFAQHLVPDDP